MVHHVQHFGSVNFVSGAAGRDHSLLLSEHGTVFGLGSGQKAQLGRGNAFNDLFLSRDTVHQAYPRQVTPTGHHHRGYCFSYLTFRADSSLA